MRAYISVGLHWVDHSEEQFPIIDVRDEDTVWLWLGPNVHVELNKKCVDHLYWALEANKEAES